MKFAVNQEKHVDRVLQKLAECNSMTEKTRKLLKPLGSRSSGVMYSSCNIHKASAENGLSFRPILSNLNTPLGFGVSTPLRTTKLFKFWSCQHTFNDRRKKREQDVLLWRKYGPWTRQIYNLCQPPTNFKRNWYSFWQLITICLQNCHDSQIPIYMFPRFLRLDCFA